MPEFDTATSDFERKPAPVSRKERRARRDYQRLCEAESILPAAACDRVVREILQDMGDDYRMSS